MSDFLLASIKGRRGKHKKSMTISFSSHGINNVVGVTAKVLPRPSRNKNNAHRSKHFGDWFAKIAVDLAVVVLSGTIQLVVRSLSAQSSSPSKYGADSQGD